MGMQHTVQLEAVATDVMNSSGNEINDAEKLMEPHWRNKTGHINSSIDPRNYSGISLIGSSYEDYSFWTKEQLILIENFPPNAFIVMGLIVSVIAISGLTANGMVLFIFSRFKQLRSPPANTFIVNLALSDMSAAALHSMAAYSNFNGRWAFGQLGCELYAMGITCFGLVSISTFSAIACERSLVIGLAETRWRVSKAQAQKACGFIWLHCIILVSLPFFGWSSYVPEGLLTTCSWDYKTRTTFNRAYYVLLLTAGFFLPVLLIFVCYGRILASVTLQARQMICINSQNSALRKLRRQTEIRTAQIVVTLILVYLTAWTPYAVVTLIGQFGPEEYQLSPMTTAISAYFAKTAVVLDPLVYGFSHPHFRNSLRRYVSNLRASRISKIGSDMRPRNSGISKCNSKSWPGGMPSSFQSRGMTIYPTSACCALRICQPHNCTRISVASSEVPISVVGKSERRNSRMLRTFRELSLNDIRETNFSSIQSNCMTPASKRPFIRRQMSTRVQSDLLHNFKYKVRDAEFYSEWCGSPTLTDQIAVEAR
ncbi:rhodopsin-like [Daphnia carinata]|uniref:rhodopsin-like n=1 Tax=Daphnia carinata TaxID=120202 RepID=UPI00257AF781|nr:rhodopsin-like [Daphnia carinata]